MKNTMERIGAMLVAAITLTSPARAQELLQTQTGPTTRWHDLDGDGLREALFVGAGSLRLLLNRGDSGFEDVTSRIGLGEIEARDADWVDFDADGDLDLFALGTDSIGRLFQNDDMMFHEVGTTLGLSGAPASSARWLDLDGDGFLDFAAEDASGLRVMRNVEGYRFDELRFAAEAAPQASTGKLGKMSAAHSKLGGNSTSSTGEQSATLESSSDESMGSILEKKKLSGTRRPVRPESTTEESGDSTTSSSTARTGTKGSTTTACSVSVQDESDPTRCIKASTVPTLGRLYPITKKWFVDSSTGFIGIGTLNPSTQLHVASDTAARIRIEDTDSASYSSIKDGENAQLEITKHRDAGEAHIDLNPMPDDGASDAYVRVFRTTSTTGSKSLQVMKGDGTNKVQGQIGVAGANSYFATGGGKVGIGTASPSALLHVAASSNARIRIENVNSNGYSLLLDGEEAQLDISKHRDSGNVHIDLNPTPGDGRSDAYVRFFRDITTSGSKSLQLMKGDGTATVQAQIGVDGANSFLAVGGGNVGIGTSSPQAALDVEGTVRMHKATITGGADIVEPFAASGACEPGTVVVIDPANAGALAPSNGTYDRRVAGVISGAGGVNPGLRLQQDGVLEGDVLLAMAGRVYVKCSAENGAIEPGDMLTTSDLEGHAMKSSDRSRAHGAVIGKAMSSLDEGTGLVLVLVNLQ